MTSFKVDDAEPSHAKAEVSINENSAIIGSSVKDCIALRLHAGVRDRFAASPIPTCYSAHSLLSSLRSKGTSRMGQRIARTELGTVVQIRFQALPQISRITSAARSEEGFEVRSNVSRSISSWMNL